MSLTLNQKLAMMTLSEKGMPKAKTGEKIAPIGTSDAIEAEAVVLLKK